MYLLLMRHTSKSVVSKPISGLSWMLPNALLSAIRYLIIVVLVHAFWQLGSEPEVIIPATAKQRTVKGGGGLPQPKRSTVFKVDLSLILLLSFFICHLTLSLSTLAILFAPSTSINRFILFFMFCNI